MERYDSWMVLREYPVPGRLVASGETTIAVRVFSHAFDAGMRGPAAEMFLKPTGIAGAKPIALNGTWRYAVEQDLGQIEIPPAPSMPMGLENPCSPSVLYNAMIAPLVDLPNRGAIWYQGESNSSRPEQYRTLFPTMIRDWRARWVQGDFPFLFVQLANFLPGGLEKGRWAELREAQLLALRLPATGMAVAADIGDALDVHPLNKQEVGRRLALNALAKTYGRSALVYSGPIFRSAEADGNAMRLYFDHAADGLKGHGPLNGFVIAGDDKQFVSAEARIEGSTVVVSSPQVPKPAAVRYAWDDDPKCSLYNSAGLPASPFRTDMPEH